MKLSHIKRRTAGFALPILLGIAVALGGSSVPDEAPRLWLSLATLILLIALLPVATREDWSRPTQFVLLLSALWLVWCALQLVPLPRWLWSRLGDRSVIVEGLDLLGLPINQPMPISFSPLEGRLSLAATAAPLALFLLVSMLGWRKGASRLSWTVPILGALSALLGLAQILTENSAHLYFYENTNPGSPVGIFANTNHQACFLAMCLPFAAAAIREVRGNWRSGDEDHAKAIACAVLSLILLIGVLAAGSGAGYLLLVPALVLGVIIARKPASSKKVQIKLPFIVMATAVLSAIVVASSPVLGGLGLAGLDTSRTSRIEIWGLTGEVAADHWLFGTGIGSFDEVYRLYEDPDTVTRTFANHAHNDYLQAIVEFGLPGTLVVGLGLLLFGYLFFRVWSQHGDEHRHLKRAAATALLIALLHSFVDYPLRTPAVACLAATCFALLVMDPANKRGKGRRSTQQPGSHANKARHRVI
ncbi:O-antigen ligase family protein [Henriciella marina]|uniref:O-antigen ligase family protein n=1 Tax=Henriciella marina TaxID=453851 RepID=UPI0003AAB35F|nr:O-antigen ligase family protein [Henriciella marina]